MSYIGKNPKVDSVKLEGSATQASGTDEGQLYYNTGTGSISKGLKVFKNGQFVSIDKQLGDADTMQLLKAADIPAIDFSLSVTSTTVGGNNAVPFESSTGDFDGTASFSNSSTGNALLSDESADLVFHYQTQATNNADNDFFGIPLTVPRAFRGENLVLEFKYRTLIASGTMDDGYFNIAIQDRSAMISQTQASTISAGAISAGSNVLLTGKTFANPVTGTTLTVAVGDRVYVESGTGTAGSQDNDIVEAYITSVSSTDNNVTLSKDIVAVQSGKFVTGWLTSPDVEGQISAFASDTNKDGTTKKIQFKTEADTQQISLWFFVKGSSTVKHDLFFDNILLSGNKFLQANSKLNDEAFQAQGANLYSTNNTRIPYYSTEGINTSSKLVSIENSSTNGLSFTALQPCYMSGVGVFRAGGTGEYFGISINASTSQMDSNIHTISGANILAIGHAGDNNYFSLGFARKLEVGDVIRPHGGNSSGTFQSTSDFTISANFIGDDNSTIILESQDEIFTDYVDYTPTLVGFGSATNVTAQYRRVGTNIEIFGSFTSGNVTTDLASISLPSGLNISTGVAAISAGPQLGRFTSNETILNSRYLYFQPGETDKVYITEQSAARAPTTRLQGSQASTSTTICDFWASIPIQGYNAKFNPLLSLPLVEIGGNVEYYSAFNFTGGSSKSYRAVIRNASTDVVTNSVSNLGTVNNDATNGWYFESNQRVKVTINFALSSGTGVTGASVVKFGPSDTPSSLANNNNGNSQWHGKRVVGPDESPGTGYKVSSGGAFIMEAGEYIQIVQDTTSFQDNDQNTLNMVVEKDFSNTNMAHIIKPAVATLKNVLGGTTDGGTTSSGSFQKIPLNTVEGESWFVTLNDSTDVFTLQPGTYEIDAVQPLVKANRAAVVIFDEDNSTFPIVGTSNYFDNSNTVAGESSLRGTITVTTSTQFSFKYIVSNGHGTGLGENINRSDINSIYGQVKIRKLK